MSQAMTPQARHGAAALPWLLVAAGAWAYHNSLSGPFIYDDLPAIVENAHIRRLWPLWAPMSTPAETTVDGRPIVSLTLAINYALGGLNVQGYHAANLAFHLLAGLVLFGLLRRTLSGGRMRKPFGGEAAWLAGGLTLIWLVHPLLTESVTYVIQRSEVLMGLCLLGTLYATVRGAQAKEGRRWYAAAVAACAVGMGSKETMLFAPLLVLLYDRTFLSASFHDALRRRGPLYLGLSATWLVLAACVMTSTHRRDAGFGFAHVTPWDYAVTELGVLLHYLRLSVWPHPLVVDYGDWSLARHLTEVWPAAVIVLGMLAWTLWALARRFPVGFLGAWFFLILGPTSSVLPIVTEPVAERRMYLPLVAVVTVIVLGARRLLRQIATHTRVRRFALAALVVAVAAAFSALTLRRNEDYRTAVRIWSDAAQKRPMNPRAHSNLGYVFLQEGRLDAAIASSREALRLYPDYAEAHNNLGAALTRHGAVDQAIGHYAAAQRLRPDYAESHNNLGLVAFQQGRVTEAIAHYTEALRLRPDFAQAHNNLGVALSRKGVMEEAFAHYNDAIRLRPDFAEAYSNAGALLAAQSRWADAVTYYTNGLRYQPHDADVYNNLGVAFAQQGRRQEAQENFSIALRLNPDDATARHNLRVLEAARDQ